MKDATNIWRDVDDVDLEATEGSITGIDVGPAGKHGHPAQVIVPAIDAEADTLIVTWQESATVGGQYRTFATMPTITGASAAGTYEIELQNRQRFVRPVLTVTGSTPNFGAVVVALDGAGVPNDLQTGDNL